MYKTYIKYKSEQKESIKNFKTEIISLNEYFENYNNNINKIIFKTDSINQLSARFKIDSKVEIKKYITDTTDIISTYPAVIKEAILQLKTVDEIFESNQIDIYRQLK